jgi:hypothetical protein
MPVFEVKPSLRTDLHTDRPNVPCSFKYSTATGYESLKIKILKKKFCEDHLK